MTVATAGARHLAHLESLGRKRSTLMDYESYLRVHLAPFFAGLPLDKIEREDIEDFIAEKRAAGLATKSILNYLGLLHAIFQQAQKRGWARTNPCKLVDKPRAGEGDPDIRFLDEAELEALLRAVPEHGLGLTDRALYLTAAMSGLRQGELLALRWRDVDWTARRVRVRQNYVRGEYGTPKSRPQRARCRSQTGSPPSSTVITSARSTAQTTTSSSVIRRRAARSSAHGCSSAT
jgi:integrase